VQRNSIVLDGNGYTLQGPRNGTGVDLSGRKNVTVQNTQIKNNDYGIMVALSISNNNTICRNNITNNNYGIIIFSHCSNNSIWGNNITNNNCGLVTLACSNNTITGNQMYANNASIILSGTLNSTVLGNNITANDGDGVKLESSSNNSIVGNRITNNQNGLNLTSYSNNNTISENNLKLNSQYNLYLDNSSDNHFYLNSFITSTGQVYMHLSANSWDNDYPSGGNYWSTNAGAAIDHFRGVYQNESGIDGIADSPYVFGSNETDHYPLMGPFGPSTMTGSNVTVFPASDVGLIFQNVSVSGSTTATEAAGGPPPPSGLVSAGPFRIVETTANYSGNTTVRIIYDDTNMTMEQEGSLSLERWDPSNASLYDVNGDWKEDAKDVFRVGKAYGTSLEGPNPPGRKYDPPCDFNHDGKIDMKDYYLVQKYYGQPTGTWVTITTYVDTANNVIYGETSHFSGIGIHYRQT
jgi:parallel beta-helix repeat protein